MARQKTVFASEMVAHLWANRHPVAIRNAGGNISAASGRLYSYGSHFIIGAFLDSPKKGGAPLLLWNAEGYSATTRKQKAYAWRALTPGQRQGITRVPMLSESNIRDVPELARECIKAAVRPLEKSKKARGRRGEHIRDARQWFDSARALFAYAGESKAAASVPELAPDATADDVAQCLAAINAAEYLTRAAQCLKDGRAAIESAEGRAASNRAGHIFAGTYARDIIAQCIDARAAFERAAGHYRSAGKKPAPAIAHGLKAAARLIDEFSPAALAESLAEQRRDIDAAERGLIETLAAMRRESRGHGMPARTLSTGRRIPYAGPWRLERALEGRFGGPFGSALTPEGAAQVWPDEKTRAARVQSLTELQNRARRINAADSINRAIEETAKHCAEWETRDGARGYTIPNPGAIRGALEKFASANGGEVPAYLQQKAAPIIEKAAAIVAAINAEKAARAARLAAENAEKIEQWRQGATVYLPRDVPLMARIVGDEVQTSHGARVPLAHAARLVRLAERVAAAGGREWAPGEGPIVGHFRVTSIAADLAAVIGCHHFSAAESRRAAELIKAATIDAPADALAE